MISERAVVETEDVGEGVSIGEFSIIRSGSRIGNGVIIHPHVVIASGVVVGDDVEIFPGAFVGKEPKGPGVLARQPSFDRKVVIGNGSSVGPNAVIYYDVVIGVQTLIGDGASIREKCRIGDRCLISRGVTMNYNTVIGDRVKIMDLTHITGNCTVADDVFISTLVATVNDNALGAHGYEDGRIAGPQIESGAMIGAGAILLPAVRVGSGAIVGSGAVVTKDVMPRTLVMGTPARLVRSLEPHQNPEES